MVLVSPGLMDLSCNGGPLAGWRWGWRVLDGLTCMLGNALVVRRNSRWLDEGVSSSCQVQAFLEYRALTLCSV